MKKVRLTIPEPCHENWNEMTPADKGRFCASCKKDVIDFSSMNDRQLAEFFKKPKTGLCGHFREEQLDRDIPIYKKRIPWLRYFFQFTWPALVWMLKSCGMKQSVEGKVLMDSPVKNETPKEMQRLVGIILPGSDIELIQSDSIQLDGMVVKYDESNDEYKKNKSGKDVKSKIMKEKVTNIQQKVLEQESKIEERLASNIKVSDDPIKMRNVQQLISGRIYGGLVANVKICKQEQSDKMETKHSTHVSAELIHIFPNPVRTGSLLTISVKDKEDLPSIVQLYDASARMVTNISEELSDESTVFNVRIPSGLARGIYFLRLINKEGNVVTKKIMVE